MNKQGMKIIGIFVLIAGCIALFILTRSEKPKEVAMELPIPTEKPSSIPVITPTLSTEKKLAPPSMMLEKGKTYKAVMSTSEGEIIIDLFADKTPITVNNFVYLSREGLYGNTNFHRVINGFMIQGGDPKGNGTGGPGYTFADEPFEGEYTRGTVAMANAGPDTNGSQFFIMHKDYPLPKNYVIFGRVSTGMEVVDAIAMAPVSANPGGEKSTPLNPVIVKNVTIQVD